MHAVISAPEGVLLDERALPALYLDIEDQDDEQPAFIHWQHPSRNGATIRCSIDVTGGPVTVTLEVGNRPAYIAKDPKVIRPVVPADRWEDRLLDALFKEYRVEFYDATHLAGTLHGLARLPVQVAT